MPVLAGQAPSSQTVGSLLRTLCLAKLGRIIWQNVSLANSLQCKNTLTNFSQMHSVRYKGPQNLIIFRDVTVLKFV
jgi:hypothetical protein